MSSEVEEIKDRLSVVELIGEYVRLTKAGSNWKALCPFHNEKTPSFMASEERRSWHCFGCGKGGDVFTFVMEMEGIGFREALEMLAQKAGVELKKFSKGDQGNQGNRGDKEKLYEILELATKWYEKNLWEGKGKDKILKYLHDRGLADGTIKKFRLGYAPDGWRNLLDFLQKKNYKIEDIAKTGLLVEKEKGNTPDARYYDRFRDRIMFPVQDVMGRAVGFSARVAPGGDEKTAKYINTPQTELYDKSKILYGIHLAKTAVKKEDAAILVEGNMDVIASHQAGFENTIAVSGTSLANEQIRAIKRYTSNVVMAFDMDAAGQTAAKRSARICLENDLNVKIMLLKSGKDAAEVLKEGKEAWEQALKNAREIIDYFFEDAFAGHDPDDPAAKKKIASALLNIIKDVASPVEKSHWVGVLARKLGIEEKILFEILGKSKSDAKFGRAKRADAAEDRVSGESRLERRILGILIAFPNESKRKISSLSSRDFSGSRERMIFEKLSVAEFQEGKGLKEALRDYELEKIAEEAAFEVEVEAKDSREMQLNPAGELEEAVRMLRRRALKEKMAKISRDLREAEASGDAEAKTVLKKEFQKLSEQLSV